MNRCSFRGWPGGPADGEWWPDRYFTGLLTGMILWAGIRHGWVAAAVAGTAVITLRYLCYWLYRRLRKQAGS